MVGVPTSGQPAPFAASAPATLTSGGPAVTGQLLPGQQAVPQPAQLALGPMPSALLTPGAAAAVGAPTPIAAVCAAPQLYMPPIPAPRPAAGTAAVGDPGASLPAAGVCRTVAGSAAPLLQGWPAAPAPVPAPAVMYAAVSRAPALAAHSTIAAGQMGSVGLQHQAGPAAGTLPSASAAAAPQDAVQPAPAAPLPAAAAPAEMQPTASDAVAAGAEGQLSRGTVGVVPPARVVTSAGVEVPVLPVAAVPQPGAPLAKLPEGLTSEQQGAVQDPESPAQHLHEAGTIKHDAMAVKRRGTGNHP